MRRVVTELPEHVHVSDAMWARIVCLNDAQCIAGIVVYHIQFFVKWSNGEESRMFDTLEELIKYMPGFEFYQL
jgi:hypothetical protein